LNSKFKTLTILSSLLLGPAAYAFPDLIREGYSSCSACHVSPSGGGILTKYGRGYSEELFTWTWEDAGSFAGIKALDSWKDPTGVFSELTTDLQAEYRSVTFRSQVPGAEPLTQTIPMERAIHAAFHVGKLTDLVISYGQYGTLLEAESRTHYLQVRLSPYLSLRGGRFMPAFGLAIDDHTALTRARLGFAQGNEALAVAAHYEDDIWVTDLTRVVGQDVTIIETNKRWVFDSPTREGMAFRSGIKFSGRHSAGVSAYHDEGRDAYGLWVSSSPIRKWLYVLAEVDEQRTIFDRTKIAFMRVGSEIYKGVVMNLDINAVRTELETRTRYGLGAQLILVPHIELRIEARREDETQTYMLMSHAWL
jgi:hypothetical protein